MQRKFIKKADIIFAAVILCVCIFFLLWRSFSSDGVTAVIYADGREYERIELDEGVERTVTPVEGVVIRIKDGAVWFEGSDCPDELCVKTGKLRRAGDTAACLPNGIVITLEGNERRHDAITGRISR